MPVKNTLIKKEALAVHKQMSYEQLAASWLLGDGWEVLTPILDHGKKTDLVIADDHSFYRIQVKTIESSVDSITVENKWGNAKIDYVIYFSRSAKWGYITPAFKEQQKKLNSDGHFKFFLHSTEFIKAFNRI